MKKIVLSLVMLLGVAFGYSQSLFDDFESMDDVSSVVISKSMFTLLSKFEVVIEDDPEAREFVHLARNLESLKVFTTLNATVAKEMGNQVNSYLKKARLTELMRVRDKQANVKFYIRPGKDDSHVKELLMFVDGIEGAEFEINDQTRKIETVLLSLVGDIDLDKIGGLIAKMNLPEELNQVNNH
jgi:hypothetical protein